MKVLQVNYKMDIGGIESFLMNLYRNINPNEIEFIFLTYSNKKFDFEDEIKRMGGKIIRISDPSKVSIIRHIKELYITIKKEKVDVVHCHTYFDSAYVMFAAYLANVKIRITHSHTTFGLDKVNFFKSLKWFISRKMIKKYSTNTVACSKLAGKALFNDSDFIVIPNGIELEKYFFNDKSRKKYRKDFGIKDTTLVIGHVGRFDIPKNHKFLLEILSEIVKVNNNVKLILVGSGKLENEIKSIAKEKRLSEYIIFLGNRNDVYDIINCFDIFVFPSLYEGFPVTLVETQANGLKSLVSSNITSEVKITKCIEFYSLEKSAKAWANKILNSNKVRINTKSSMTSSNYSIEKSIKNLINLYYQ